MDVTLLLCDSAEESGGKLYILGAGWNNVSADVLFNMALAILIAIPWDRANHQVTVLAKLMTADGEPVVMGDQQVAATGQLEVGRPPGTKPGSALNVPIALKFGGVVLPAGGYRWEIEVDGQQMATAPFHAIQR